ncbi:MAG TPA: FtsX-like permease family protein, partial [Propionibacteriaceae bacterium]
IVTALSQSESRGDLATLAALGSTVSLRRQLAGAQAGLVALTGVVLGIVVGLPAGVAVGIINTSVNYQDPNGSSATPPVIAMPWLGFAVLVVLVPLLAIAVAALGVRRVPTMTRRIN